MPKTPTPTDPAGSGDPILVAENPTFQSSNRCRQRDRHAEWLVVQHDVQQRTVNLQAPVVFDESELAKSVHEEVHS